MLNFDEQTGIGVLMIVWSFLLLTPLLAPIKTTTTIRQPTILLISHFTNNDTLYQLPLPLSPHKICIHTYARTIHLSIHHYLYIYALSTRPIELRCQIYFRKPRTYVKTTHPSLLYGSCISQICFSRWFRMKEY